jgi:uncharacterized protein YceK
MPRMAGKVVLLVGSLAVTGCGTITNVASRDRIYGGAQIDGVSVWDASKDIVQRGESPQYTIPQASVMLGFSCIDLPLSIVGDTFTLPVTVPTSCYHWWKESYGQANPATGATTVTTVGKGAERAPRVSRDEPSDSVLTSGSAEAPGEAKASGAVE